MGRKLKTNLPSLKKTQTSNSHLPLLFQKEQRYRDNQRDNFNRRHAVQQAPELKPGDSVYIKDLHRSGSIISRHPNPRSYIVDTEQGTIRRNCAHLVATPSSPVQSAPVPTSPRHLPQLPDLLFPRRVRPTPVFRRDDRRTVAQPAKDLEGDVQKSFGQGNQEAQRVDYIWHLGTHYIEEELKRPNQPDTSNRRKTWTTSSILGEEQSSEKVPGKTKELR